MRVIYSQNAAPDVVLSDRISFENTTEDPELWQSIVVYTANTVLDSEGNKGFPVSLVNATGANSSITDIQFLQCSKHVVPQVGRVDSQSGKIIPGSLQPSIIKNHSTWYEYEGGLSSYGNESMIDGGLVCDLSSRKGVETNLTLVGTNDIVSIRELGRARQR